MMTKIIFKIVMLACINTLFALLIKLRPTGKWYATNTFPRIYIHSFSNKLTSDEIHFIKKEDFKLIRFTDTVFLCV